MGILSGFKKYKRYIRESNGFRLSSQWTDTSTIEWKNGTVEGITDDADINSSTIAASTKMLNNGIISPGGLRLGQNNAERPSYGFTDYYHNQKLSGSIFAGDGKLHVRGGSESDGEINLDCKNVNCSGSITALQNNVIANAFNGKAFSIGSGKSIEHEQEIRKGFIDLDYLNVDTNTKANNVSMYVSDENTFHIRAGGASANGNVIFDSKVICDKNFERYTVIDDGSNEWHKHTLIDGTVVLNGATTWYTPSMMEDYGIYKQEITVKLPVNLESYSNVTVTPHCSFPCYTIINHFDNDLDVSEVNIWLYSPVKIEDPSNKFRLFVTMNGREKTN